MTNKVNPVTDKFRALAREKILVLDGAMGTMIQGLEFDEAPFRGERFKDFHRDVRGNNDLLILTQAQAIEDIHHAYLKAGADIVATNTFSSTSIAQADYDMSELAYDQNGDKILLPAQATHFLVRCFPRPGTRGAPRICLDRNGSQLRVPVEQPVAEFIEKVDGRPGRYRLDPCDEHGRIVPNVPPAYFTLSDQTRNAESGGGDERDKLHIPVQPGLLAGFLPVVQVFLDQGGPEPVPGSSTSVGHRLDFVRHFNSPKKQD